MQHPPEPIIYSKYIMASFCWGIMEDSEQTTAEAFCKLYIICKVDKKNDKEIGSLWSSVHYTHMCFSPSVGIIITSSLLESPFSYILEFFAHSASRASVKLVSIPNHLKSGFPDSDQGFVQATRLLLHHFKKSCPYKPHFVYTQTG